MKLELPKPVEAYFETKHSDVDALANCFTENGVVEDEEQTYRGQDSIRDWAAGSSQEYSFTSEPFASEQHEGQLIVTSKVSGTFPGSPINLRYTFVLEGDKIASLQIAS